MPPKANHRRRQPPGALGSSRPGEAPTQGFGTAASPVGGSTRQVRAPGVSPSETAVGAAAEAGALCPVCASVFADLAVGTCGHGVCASCSHRLRFLYKRTACVLCNAVNEQVAVIPAAEFEPGRTTAESVRTAWTQRGRSPMAHDQATDMFFVDDALMKRLALIAGFTCPVYVSALLAHDENAQATDTGAVVGDAADHTKVADARVSCRAPSHRSPGALRAHVREQHRALYCDICFESKKEYLSMMPTYTTDAPGGKQSAVREHMHKEHPRCKFCNIHVLGDDELFQHLQTNHEACRICEREGRQHQYFRNYPALEVHFRAHHFVCEDQNCRGVVFASDIDLQAHILQQHRADLPRNSRARRLQVDLTELHTSGVRRQGRGDQSRPPALDSEEDIRLEQERQAARRRSFLASNVVYSSEGTGLPGRAGPGPVPDTMSSTSRPIAGDRPTAAVTRPDTNSEDATRGRSVRGHGRPMDDASDEIAFYERNVPSDASELTARNRILISTIRSALDPAEFELFRSLSGDFREQRIGAEEYYSSAIDSFGVRKAVCDILPELAALLPSVALREDLVRVCTRRHPPMAREGGQIGDVSPAFPQTVANVFPRRNAPLDSQDAFPSLSGAPLVTTVAPLTNISVRSRIASAPLRNDDFPRLSRVNFFPQGSEVSDASRPVEARARTTGAHQRVSANNQRTTAAHVPMQPNLSRVFGDTSGVVGAASRRTSPMLAMDAFPSLSQQSAGPTGHLQLNGRTNFDDTQRDAVDPLTRRLNDSDVFPSLSSQADQPDAVNVRSLSTADQRGSEPGPAGPDPDVSMRAGAVWGGASSRAINGNRKRGPGRGAPSVGDAETQSRPLSGSPASFPALARPGDALMTNEHSSSNDGTSSSKKKSVVIDVPSLARDKKSKSALPKVGGSGYGFAWERKKMQAKQREVKTTLSSSSKQSSERAPDHGGSQDRPLLSGTPTQSVASVPHSISLDRPENGAASTDLGDRSASNSNTDGEHCHLASVSNAVEEFAYLAVNHPKEEGDDPIASFFRS